MTDEELIARLRDFKKVTVWETHDAADRIEALIEQLAAAQDDAKEAEAYAGEVEREQKGWQEAAVKLMNKLTISEAKLAKAVEALEYYAVEALPWEADDSLQARKALAEIKGGNDAKSDL